MTEQRKRPLMGEGVVGYASGGWDLFHLGHVNVIREARRHCDWLIVGVATDESLYAMKGRYPIVPFSERLAIIEAIRWVDAAVPDVSGDKVLAWEANRFDVIFKGSDWQGSAKGAALEQAMAGVGARVQYFPYTPLPSTSSRREEIRELIEAMTDA